ncbi:MAG: GNAT family N-acetyltransferase [Campylobacterales bacterium]|nr:GNAT family N-acetyltransferase [Campylobacterales bacterium]
MIKIEKLTEPSVEKVRQILLSDEQIKFAGTAEEFLKSGTDTIDCHIIKLNNEVVGFFKIDLKYTLGDEFNIENGLGLRAFAIDIKHQGKGLGTLAVKALFPYLKENYSAYSSMYLTVNCKNPGALACYLKGGFEDTGKQYIGGAAGPQYIMQVKI